MGEEKKNELKNAEVSSGKTSNKLSTSKSNKKKLKNASHSKKSSVAKRKKSSAKINPDKTPETQSNVDKAVALIVSEAEQSKLKQSEDKPVEGVPTQVQDSSEPKNTNVEAELKDDKSAVSQPDDIDALVSEVKIREKKYSKKESRRRIILRASIAIGIVACIYLVTALVFFFNFYPNTYIGDYSLSGKSMNKAYELVDEVIGDYKLNVADKNGYSLQVAKGDVALHLNKDQVKEYIDKTQNPFLWPVEIFMPHDLSPLVEESYDDALLRELVADSIFNYNQDREGPTNATAIYNPQTNYFDIQEEKQGTKLDLESSYEDIKYSLVRLYSSLRLTDDNLLHP
ncbi:MAG: hypothetical protein HUJ63_04055, partial [Enterococcus sp.]|nr:hypothetical protein [Enterococcus sp.]